MHCNINGTTYTISTHVREEVLVRESFFGLARSTFGLDFEPWFQNGYWTDNYIPYALLDGNRVVANISVNVISTEWKGIPKRYIQLGTVMTAEEYRGRGLSRFLMETVIGEQVPLCDAIYLFANDSVLDFYPRFGFVPAKEYQYRLHVMPRTSSVRKLDMELVADRQLLLDKYTQLNNPFSALPMKRNIGLLMFYCRQWLKDCVYYIEDCDVVAIVQQVDTSLLCYDLFGSNEGKGLNDILSALVTTQVSTVVFGFPLKDMASCPPVLLKEEDTTLFIFNEKENLFATNQLMFPLLSHA